MFGEVLQLIAIVGVSFAGFVILYAAYMWILAKLCKIPFKEVLKWKK